ncbi:MAG: hypothetical protein AAGF73_02620 [Actinomycetota bacterium]
MNDDRIRRGLAAAADEIEPGDAAEVRASLTARVRRRRLLARGGALAVVVALVAAIGIVAVSIIGDDEPATLVGVDPTTTTAPPTTAPPTTVADVPVTVVDDSSDSDSPVVSIVEQPATASGPASAERGSATGGSESQVLAGSGSSIVYPEIAVPWRDGFLVAASRAVAQPLPNELPEDIRELFPQEVLDLFPDGLPPTISEAQQILSDAGLLDEVTEVLAAHPEANEAVYSQSAPPSEYDARFTIDGNDWEPIDLVLPESITWLAGAQSDGERLVALGSTTTDDGTESYAVASTSDLVLWDVQPIPLSGRADYPDIFLQFRSPISFAVSGDRWVAQFTEHVQLDPSRLPPQFADGYSPYVVAEGIRLERWIAGVDAPETVTTITWSELDIAEDVGAAIAASWQGGAPLPTQLYSAAIGGDVVSSEGPATYGSEAQVLATPAGFVGFFDGVRFSADGVEWQLQSDLDEQSRILGSMGMGDGIVLFTVDRSGAVVGHRLDDQGRDLGAVEVSALPDGWAPLTMGFAGGGTADRVVLVDAGQDQEMTAEPLQVVEDGFTLTVNTSSQQDWTLIEDLTGTVVAAGPFAASDDQEFMLDFGPGIRVTNASSGEVVAEFSDEAYNAALRALSPPSYGYRPDLWLFAAGDDGALIVEDLPEDSGEFYGGWAIVNGDRALVGTGDSWFIVNLP